MMRKNRVGWGSCTNEKFIFFSDDIMLFYDRYLN